MSSLSNDCLPATFLRPNAYHLCAMLARVGMPLPSFSDPLWVQERYSIYKHTDEVPF